MAYDWIPKDPYGRFHEWPVPEMVEFGQLVRRARRSAGLNQHELARLSRVSQSTICRLENGLVPGMAIWKLVKIAMALRGRLPIGSARTTTSAATPYTQLSDSGTYGRLLRPDVRARLTDTYLAS